MPFLPGQRGGPPAGGLAATQRPSQEVTMQAGVTVQAPPPPPSGGGAAVCAPPPELAIAGARMYHAPPRRLSTDGSGVGKRWSLAQLRATDALVPLQSGTNRFDSQQGMRGFGTPRNTSTKVKSDNPVWFPSDGCHGLPVDGNPNDWHGRWTLAELKQTDALIPLQSGTNRHASQKGMTGFGTPRDVKGTHLKRIWELEYPEEVDGFGDEQTAYQQDV